MLLNICWYNESWIEAGVTSHFHVYENFYFLVNGKRFKTSRIIADLISPKISQQHFNDPTINQFTINTKNKGVFSYIIDLASFKEIKIPEKEFPFIFETFEILEISPQTHLFNPTNDNLLEQLKIRYKYQHIYLKTFKSEIDFISLHFNEFLESNNTQLFKLSPEILEQIINNPKLKLNNEDQLLSFINQLYINDSNYAYLYNYVHFLNVESSSIKEFLEIFDINDISKETWRSLSLRLMQQITTINEDESHENSERYRDRHFFKGRSKVFKFESNDKFCGIINYFRSNSDGNIDNKINITTSTTNSSFQGPKNSICFEKLDNYFASKDRNDSWICFEFINHSIIPTDYTIRSPNFSHNSQHLRSWLLEGSNDLNNWGVLDEQKDCSFLNGPNYIHTFHIDKPKEVKYIRIKETGPNWNINQNYNLVISAFEIYGTLIWNIYIKYA